MRDHRKKANRCRNLANVYVVNVRLAKVSLFYSRNHRSCATSMRKPRNLNITISRLSCNTETRRFLGGGGGSKDKPDKVS